MTGESSSTVETSLLEKLIQKALESRFGSRGGSGDGEGGLEQRIGRLEVDLAEIRTTLTRLESKVDQVPKATDLFELKGRVSQLPTLWQLFGLMIGIFAAAFALVRLAAPH